MESAASRVVDVYQRHAVTWSRERGDRLQEKAWLDRFLAVRPEPLYHASLASDEYRGLLRDNGFDVLQHVVEDPTCGQRTVWLARQ